MASVDDLGPLLQSMTTLKPPGVSKSKIAEINNICIAHIGSDSAIIERLATHYSTTPSTHNLGVLYVVDSITRKWVEKATQAGQPLIGGASAPGTYASGIHKMTGILPTLMNDLIMSAPANQKDKISKLIDIWEQAKTFPEDMLGDFKRKLAGPTQVARTFPSAGTPKPESNPALANPATNGAPQAQSVQLTQNVSSTAAVGMLQQLPQAAALLQGTAAAPDAAQLALQQNLLAAAMQAAAIQPPAAGAPPNPAMLLQALMTPQIAANFQQAPVTQPAAPPPPPQAPPAVPPVPTLNPQHIQILQGLLAANVPTEQIAQVVSMLGIPLPPAPPPPGGVPAQPANAAAFQANGAQNLAPAPAASNQEYKRSRSRSRSPDYSKRRRITPPNRRESPVYGVYDPDAARTEGSRPQENNERRGRNRGRGRKSPQNRQNERAQSPNRGSGGNTQPKFIAHDRSISKGHIRVLSRTLFVGGVAAPEPDIRNIFGRFGKVQTCIVNQDRRHAFVKMTNRQGALNAKEGMDKESNPDVLSKARSTRWGVGFGPRECSDYSKGESVVPISALTEADKRWLLTAEYGGTGGKPIESGMVVEEPDIEIGAGVSSKAISRRIETSAAKRQERGGGHHRNHGQAAKEQPQQERYGYGYDRGPANAPKGPAHDQPRSREQEQGRGKQQHNRFEQPPMLKPEPNTVGVPPAVPGFGFQLPGVNLNLR